MTSRTATSRPVLTRISIAFAIRTGLVLAAGLGVASGAVAQTMASTPGAAAHAVTQAPWEIKLDRALRSAADTDPDTTRRVTVHLVRADAADKAHALTSFGFPVLETIDARTIVVSLTAREAMVLAEDADLERFTLEAPMAGIATAVAQDATTGPTR
jgi:hypothetical protein